VTDYPTSKTRPANIDFVLDAEALRRPARVLDESGGTQEYAVKFADGRTVRFPNVEQVIGQPNTRENPIVSLIAGTPQPISIVFRGTPDPTVEYTINGPQKEVIYLADKLDEWMSSIAGWYSWLRVPTYSLGVLAITICAPFLLWSYVLPHFFIDQTARHAWTKPCFFIACWILEWWATKLFPRAVFAIGQGERRYGALKKLRATFFVAIPSAIVLGWITTWLHDHYR